MENKSVRKEERCCILEGITVNLSLVLVLQSFRLINYGMSHLSLVKDLCVYQENNKV